MEVRIVAKKNDVKEMTVEELCDSGKFIGFERGTYKCMLVRTNQVFVFAFPLVAKGDDTVNGCWSSDETLYDLLKDNVDDGTYHVFDTDKELHKWMAE